MANSLKRDVAQAKRAVSAGRSTVKAARAKPFTTATTVVGKPGAILAAEADREYAGRRGKVPRKGPAYAGGSPGRHVYKASKLHKGYCIRCGRGIRFRDHVKA